MKLETVKIADLSPDPANARKHPERNLQQITASLKRFGQQKPIVVDSKGVVRAGNGTLAAAIALGWDKIKIVRSDLPATEMTAYAIVDNRSAELAEWDTEILAGVLSDPDIGDLGFDDPEIAKLTALPEPEVESADDQPTDEKFMVLVTLPGESDQLQFLAEMNKRGLECKSIVT